MGRRQVRHGLPSLRRIVPKIGDIGRTEAKFDRIVAILRAIANASRREEPQDFYSQRQVARKFGVAVSLVARAFSKLREEGILRSIGGSKTVLESVSFDHALHLRGMVVLPVALSEFVASDEYRSFFLRIVSELRRRGFFAYLEFHSRGARAKREFIERLIRYRADIVLWLHPRKGLATSMRLLSEKGIQSVAIGARHTPLPLNYILSKTAAIEEAVTHWRAAGSEKANVIASLDLEVNLYQLRSGLREAAFAYEIHDARLPKVRRILARKEESSVLIFADGRAATLVELHFPEKFLPVFQTQRVMFIEGAPNTPFYDISELSADLVVFDWQLIAEQIVSDLVANKVNTGHPAVFEATFKPRALLGFNMNPL